MIVGAALATCGAPAHSADRLPIAGDYECVSDCRPSDAPPAIEIDGRIARCRSELGGI